MAYTRRCIENSLKLSPKEWACLMLHPGISRSFVNLISSREGKERIDSNSVVASLYELASEGGALDMNVAFLCSKLGCKTLPELADALVCEESKLRDIFGIAEFDFEEELFSWDELEDF